MTQKNRKKLRNFKFWSNGFSCGLDVLYGGLGISKLQFWSKNINYFPSINFFKILVMKTLDLDLDPDPHSDSHWPKMLDLDPYRVSWSALKLIRIRNTGLKLFLWFAQLSYTWWVHLQETSLRTLAPSWSSPFWGQQSVLSSLVEVRKMHYVL